MTLNEIFQIKLIKDAWDVLALFLVPVGGGIPAGVVLAQSRGIPWPVMMFLYFISDIVLACVFEPLMLLFLYYSRRSARLMRFRQILALSTRKTVSRYGHSPTRLQLIIITFGTDPMTGRSVAKAAGHNFLSGWTLTIMGDMIFFSVIMISTIWLNNILGDGTWTAIIITLIIIGGPQLLAALKSKRKN